MTRSHRTSLLAISFMLLAAGGYLVWRWPIEVLTGFLGPRAAAPTITVSGNIEAHESVLSFTQVQAPIVELPFDEGAAIKQETVLARSTAGFTSIRLTSIAPTRRSRLPRSP